MHRPLAQVPENTLKFAVGLMLSSFGVFWTGEGLGAEWPGADLSLVGIFAIFAVFALTARRHDAPPAATWMPPDEPAALYPGRDLSASSSMTATLPCRSWL